MPHSGYSSTERGIHTEMYKQAGTILAGLRGVPVALLVAMPLFCMGLVVAHADRIPGSAYAGKAYYFTTSEELVKVNFSVSRKYIGLEERKKLSPLVVGEIERAYIYFATGYNQNTYKILPDEIWVPQVHLMLTYPDGLPLSQAITKKQKTLQSTGRKSSKVIAARKLRSSIYTVVLRAISDNANRQFNTIRNPFAIDRGEKLIGQTSDGLQHYAAGPKGPMVYLDHEEPILRRINCSKDLERSHSQYYCKYQIILSENLLAEASFVDFRFHGGRSFVQKRILRLREILCKKFPCENPAKFLVKD